MSEAVIRQTATEDRAKPLRARQVKEHAELQTMLDGLLRETTEGELIELLADMNREGALAVGCDELDCTRWWFTEAAITTQIAFSR